MQHEHIVKLYGTASTSMKKDFFLVLELLSESLEQRLSTWMRAAGGKERGHMQGLLPSSSSRLAQRAAMAPEAILECIRSSAVGSARALEYIHKRGFVYQDLKPENVGFDMNGTVKLFDFGFARPLQDLVSQKIKVAGSLRYQAPEAALVASTERGTTRLISAKIDVYSFGIFLWEICVLQKPFRRIREVPQFMKRVVRGNFRPPTHHIVASPLLRGLICDCWSPDASSRPSISDVIRTLENACHELSFQDALSSSTRRLALFFLARTRFGSFGSVAPEKEAFTWFV